MKIKGNIWIEMKNGMKMGKGRADLLQQIGETGSITRAAEKLNISYRKAWAMLNQMNDASGPALVEKTIGGVNGGGTLLTSQGEKILKKYHLLQEEFENFKRKNLKNL